MSATWEIGRVAARAGVATSALRFYEDEGLISSIRNEGGHRRFDPSVLRRVAFIRTAQHVGLTLEEIKDALASLPDGRNPHKRDWERLSRLWKERLDERIKLLAEMRDNLTDCIGCGCLSLRTCNLYNPKDKAAVLGDGARFWLGDDPQQFLVRDDG